eukprot:SAG31_NODE_368_length_16798_cov_20.422780_10_plen_113_part_00
MTGEGGCCSRYLDHPCQLFGTNDLMVFVVIVAHFACSHKAAYGSAKPSQAKPSQACGTALSLVVAAGTDGMDQSFLVRNVQNSGEKILCRMFGGWIEHVFKGCVVLLVLVQV